MAKNTPRPPFHLDAALCLLSRLNSVAHIDAELTGGSLVAANGQVYVARFEATVDRPQWVLVGPLGDRFTVRTLLEIRDAEERGWFSDGEPNADICDACQ